MTISAVSSGISFRRHLSNNNHEA